MSFYAICGSVDVSTNSVSGGPGGGVTPVPIPNTAVKPSCADDTAWETVWERRSPPDLFTPKGRWFIPAPLFLCPNRTHPTDRTDPSRAPPAVPKYPRDRVRKL